MKPRTCQLLMSLVESSKHVGIRSPHKLVRAFRHYKYLFASKVANFLINRVNVKDLAPNKGQSVGKFITASLTTFPARIKVVRYAILSILLQTRRPDRVILWLAEEQFPDKQIPENLRDLCGYGLEVRFCDDLRSHKKYYYSLQQQKENELVVTFDDDIIYHPRTIARLVEKHLKYPNCIICSQVHIIAHDEEHKLAPYHKWGLAHDGMDTPSKSFMPLTGSGCLYPYGVMPTETFDKDKIRAIAFTADDLWIGAMALMKGTLICPPKIVARQFSVVGESQSESLSQVNCIGDGNDETLVRLQKEYKLFN